MKYRKKPVVVDAFHWQGQDKSMWSEWLFNSFSIREVKHSQHNYSKDMHAKPLKIHNLSIETLEGTMTVSLGDWIIRGIKGEIYPCKPDIFAKTYEEVEE